MIAAKIFITHGSNPRLLASSVTARFVKMHRTKVPESPVVTDFSFDLAGTAITSFGINGEN